MLGTINYEVTCMLDRRIPRVYKENNETAAIVNILEKLNRYDSVFLFLTNEKCSVCTGDECP